jgi:nitroreductase
LTLPHVANADLEVLAEDWRIGSERVAHFLKGRRSTRVYQDQPLENATIEELIRVAQYAPSGHNSQPLGWTVVSQRERVRAITETTVDWMRLAMAQGSSLVTPLNMPAVVTAWDSGHDTISRGAPHLVIAHAPEQLPTGAHAAAIAITYFDLAATSRGLGTCWAGFVFVGAGASPAVHAALGLPNGQRCAGAVFVGYPAIPFRRIPARRTPTIRWT